MKCKKRKALNKLHRPKKKKKKKKNLKINFWLAASLSLEGNETCVRNLLIVDFDAKGEEKP